LREIGIYDNPPREERPLGESRQSAKAKKDE
jgi:hypothetical protein